MVKSRNLITIFLILFGQILAGQSTNSGVTLNLIKKKAEALPGEVLNFPFFVRNSSARTITITGLISAPEGWIVISRKNATDLNPGEQQFSVFTLHVPSDSPVGEFDIPVKITDKENSDRIYAKGKVSVSVKEVENISLQLVKAPEYITGGELLEVKYLIQNLGNTSKSVEIQTNNCTVKGDSEIKLEPGGSSSITVFKETSANLTDTKKELCTVRAMVGDKMMKSVYNTVIVFPGNDVKKDMFHRIPVTLSATYVSANQYDKYESALQFEMFGSGSLDPKGNHKLEFLARGPNNSDLSFLGMYDQYYVSYASKNVELFAGQKAFAFTPLTESSRFGTGTENKFRLNNGLFMGFLYVKPRFYRDIENEFAVFSGFEKDRNNIASVYYVAKKNNLSKDLTYLASFNSRFEPFKKTTIEFELSRGMYQDIADNAYRTNINSQFSVFRLAGSYFNAGKNYPGYYSNSTFYSGNFFANITSKLNVGVYAREDFINAQLDTFFLYAPYSKSFQYILNYNLSPGAYVKLFCRDYERKDRLELNKFHYKTNSINAQIRHKIKRFDYNLLGEIGKTTNLLLQPGENKQETYRASMNVAYRFSPKHAVRFFGSWSNINRFVSGEKRNITAGMSVNSQILRNLKANFYIQNAYDIDDYYRNRNLMQLNLVYNFLKDHKITLRSFYTIFRRQTENPEFTLSATYAYNFGLPVKRLVWGGDVKGRIVDQSEKPVEGVILHLMNRLSVTDKYGDFWFKSVPPGKYLLYMDNSKFELNEVTNIPMPLEVDVLEDREKIVNIKVTQGIKVTGQFKIVTSGVSRIGNSDISSENIVVELYSETENYRISSDENGKFSFPVVRPGKWTLKIYSTSLPSGYETSQTIYNFDLKPGEKQYVNIELKKKKRNIKFQQQQFSLSTSELKNNNEFQVSKQTVSEKKAAKVSVFYSVQIGAFQRRLRPGDKFFKGRKFDHEKQINNLYRYFIGTFENLTQAKKEREILEKEFRGAYIVLFKNGEVVYDY